MTGDARRGVWPQTGPLRDGLAANVARRSLAAGFSARVVVEIGRTCPCCEMSSS
jgi:hypothetical protein